MPLVQDLHEGYLFFRRGDAARATIVDREVAHSFLLAPDRLVDDWPVASADAFDLAAIAPILALDPEVVLLGTGVRQVFPPRETQVALLRRRIGLEVMDNAAAYRTFNLLASEGRRVVAAIILGNASAGS